MSQSNVRNFCDIKPNACHRHKWYLWWQPDDEPYQTFAMDDTHVDDQPASGRKNTCRHQILRGNNTTHVVDQSWRNYWWAHIDNQALNHLNLMPWKTIYIIDIANFATTTLTTHQTFATDDTTHVNTKNCEGNDKTYVVDQILVELSMNTSWQASKKPFNWTPWKPY